MAVAAAKSEAISIGDVADAYITHAYTRTHKHTQHTHAHTCTHTRKHTHTHTTYTGERV